MNVRAVLSMLYEIGVLRDIRRQSSNYIITGLNSSVFSLFGKTFLMQIQSNRDRWDWTRGEAGTSEGSYRLELEPHKIRERDCNTVAVSVNPCLDAMIPALFSSYS